MAGLSWILSLFLVVAMAIKSCQGFTGDRVFDSSFGVGVMKKLVDATAKVFNESGIPTGIQPDDPLILKYPLEIIKDYGYPSATEVNITTQDGYILTLWRIKCPKNVTECAPRRPALFQHGLLMSGADWLFVDEDAIIPFRLAQEYDVWIGNSRGNRYSRNHINSSYTLDLDSPYWEFSVEQMAVFDLPATIDHLLKESGFPKINYVGYSMGTTMFYILMSEKFDKYNDRINKAVLLAPALVIDGLGYTSKSPLSKLLTVRTVKRTVIGTVLLGLIQALEVEDGPVPDPDVGRNETVTGLQLLKIFNVPRPHHTMTQALLNYLLTEGATAVKNPTAVLRGIGHAQGGGSLRTIRHFVQFYKTGKFMKYQFKNPEKNCEEYGSVAPPHYNITLFARTLVIAGGNDSLVVLSDAKKTAVLTTKARDCLPNMCIVRDFTHMDFIYGNSTELKQSVTNVVAKFFKDGYDFQVERDCFEPQFDESWDELKKHRGNCTDINFAQRVANNMSDTVDHKISSYYGIGCKQYKSRAPKSK